MRGARGGLVELFGKIELNEDLHDNAGEAESFCGIVADYNDSVLHVFTDEMRSYYRLEDLWSDVPKLEAAATA